MQRAVAVPLTVTVVTLTGVVGAPVSSSASSAQRLQIATFSAAEGGSSRCVNVGTTGLSCSHNYGSYDFAAGVETCAEAGTGAIGVSTCHASMVGPTSGTGRAVGEDGLAVCSTSGVTTLTFSFAGASGAYPPFKVSATIEDGDGTFAGVSPPVLLPGVGLAVQSAKGKFTLGCGPSSLRGSFVGGWTLTTLDVL